MKYSIDPAERSVDSWLLPLVGDRFARQELCGRSLNSGLLRFHDSRSGPIGQQLVQESFRPRGLRADVFAYDWLARQFAVTDSFTPDGRADQTRASRTVVVLDPFDMTTTPWVHVSEFEQALAVPLAQEQLEYSLFKSWLLGVGIERLALDRCAGATVPGFYGGKRDLDNLRHDDIDVFLSFTLQLWAHYRNSPPGSPPPRLKLHEGD